MMALKMRTRAAWITGEAFMAWMRRGRWIRTGDGMLKMDASGLLGCWDLDHGSPVLTGGQLQVSSHGSPDLIVMI